MKWEVLLKKIYKFYIIAFGKFWWALNVFNLTIFCFCAVFEWRKQLIMICMKAVCFIKRGAISACYVSFFLIFLLKVFARDPSWQQDCRGVEQLPAKIPDVPFNPPGSNSNWQNQVYDLEQDPCTVLGLHQTIAGIALQINENLDHLWSFYLEHSVSQLSNMSISYFWSNIILGHTDCALGVRNSLEMNLLKVVITIRPPTSHPTLSHT